MKIFHDQSPRKNVADLGGGWTRDLQLSYRGRSRFKQITSLVYKPKEADIDNLSELRKSLELKNHKR